MRISFLFWNLNKQPRKQIVTNLAHYYDVDVIMLAECVIDPTALLLSLNYSDASYHYVPQIGCTKIEILTRFPSEFIPPVHESHRLTIRHLRLPTRTDILLTITHFADRRNFSEESQNIESVNLSRDIQREERNVGHARTVLVGDLNMPPFQAGVADAACLHGVMTRDIAQRGSRIVQGKQYPFFYNPMWSLLGDATPGAPGTYYRNTSEYHNYFWYMLDQVLIRPELLDRFNNDDLEIVHTDGQTSFLSENGPPNVQVASDHLPIFFKLDL